MDLKPECRATAVGSFPHKNTEEPLALIAEHFKDIPMWPQLPDRVFIEGAGNPNLLWAEDQQRLVVIDHNLAFDPSLMADFWTQHAFRDARQVWSAAFCDGIGAEFRAALGQLQTIWNEMPEEWTEVECGLSLAGIESLLWQFDREADTFWSRL